MLVCVRVCVCLVLEVQRNWCSRGNGVSGREKNCERQTERERETELLTRQTHAHLLRLLRGGVNQSAIHINVFGPVFQLRHGV